MCCQTSSSFLQQEKTRDDALHQELLAEKAKANQTVRLLCLGTPNSGRSTLVKQSKIIYGSGFDDRDRDEYGMYILNRITKYKLQLSK